MSDVDILKYAEYFRQIGATEVAHTDKGYLAHAGGVARDLRRWGYGDDLYKAAVFHSIYGTELFQGFTLPLERRDEVREQIGERAEYLAYLNCAMDRGVFDESIKLSEGPYPFVDRYTGETLMLDEQDFSDLVALQVCDWLEQVARSKMWDYRREAYATMAARMGGIAQEEYDREFALEASPREEAQ